MFEIEVLGDKELVRKLDRLAGAALRKLARPAVARAIVPVNKAAKRNAKQYQETGTLWRSIGRKIKTYGKWDVVWAGVGPRKGFEGVGPDGRRRVPANYAHLVELGHVIVGKGQKKKRGSWARSRQVKKLMAAGQVVPARPFLKPALDTQKPMAMAILTREIKKRLEQEARKR